MSHYSRNPQALEAAERWQAARDFLFPEGSHLAGFLASDPLGAGQEVAHAELRAMVDRLARSRWFP